MTATMYLYDVAAAAASVVLTVDITKRKRKKMRTWVRPLSFVAWSVGGRRVRLAPARTASNGHTDVC